MVPPGEGNEARGDGRRGVGVSHSTAEAGELRPRDPVEGRGHRQVAPLEGKTANTPRLGSVSTSRQRIAELARQAVGMAVAIAWLPGPAGTRRRVAKLSVEEPDAAEPARPDLWGARVSNDPGLPDQRPGPGASAGPGRSRRAHTPPGLGALRRAVGHRLAQMTPPSTQVTTLLTRFGLTTAAEEIVPRLTQAGHHEALAVLLEVFEAEARRQRRIARLRRAARLPPGKTFETLDTGRLPAPVVRQLETLATGAFIETATNVLAFGLPGVGKSHALCALGHALVEAGHSVLCAPAYALVQELLSAKRDLDLPRALRKLDLFDVILLDDLGYVQQSPEEAEVLFTLLAERYERRSVMVTSNLVFSQWDRIFRDQMATAAAIDRLVHHAVVLEFDVPSYRTDRSRRKSPPPATPRGRSPGPLLPRVRRAAAS